jgi:putative membrane protein
MDPVFVNHLLAALAFALVGLVFFAIAFVIMVKATPFSVRKEIEDDQNVALAVIMASVIIGIALIIGMAIQG